MQEMYDYSNEKWNDCRFILLFFYYYMYLYRNRRMATGASIAGNASPRINELQNVIQQSRRNHNARDQEWEAKKAMYQAAQQPNYGMYQNPAFQMPPNQPYNARMQPPFHNPTMNMPQQFQNNNQMTRNQPPNGMNIPNGMNQNGFQSMQDNNTQRVPALPNQNYQSPAKPPPYPQDASPRMHSVQKSKVLSPQEYGRELKQQMLDKEAMKSRNRKHEVCAYSPFSDAHGQQKNVSQQAYAYELQQQIQEKERRQNLSNGVNNAMPPSRNTNSGMLTFSGQVNRSEERQKQEQYARELQQHMQQRDDRRRLEKQKAMEMDERNDPEIIAKNNPKIHIPQPPVGVPHGSPPGNHRRQRTDWNGTESKEFAKRNEKQEFQRYLQQQIEEKKQAELERKRKLQLEELEEQKRIENEAIALKKAFEAEQIAKKAKSDAIEKQDIENRRIAKERQLQEEALKKTRSHPIPEQSQSIANHNNSQMQHQIDDRPIHPANSTENNIPMHQQQKQQNNISMHQHQQQPNTINQQQQNKNSIPMHQQQNNIPIHQHQQQNSIPMQQQQFPMHQQQQQNNIPMHQHQQQNINLHSMKDARRSSMPSVGNNAIHISRNYAMPPMQVVDETHTTSNVLPFAQEINKVSAQEINKASAQEMHIKQLEEKLLRMENALHESHQAIQSDQQAQENALNVIREQMQQSLDMKKQTITKHAKAQQPICLQEFESAFDEEYPSDTELPTASVFSNVRQSLACESLLVFPNQKSLSKSDSIESDLLQSSITPMMKLNPSYSVKDIFSSPCENSIQYINDTKSLKVDQVKVDSNKELNRPHTGINESKVLKDARRPSTSPHEVFFEEGNKNFIEDFDYDEIYELNKSRQELLLNSDSMESLETLMQNFNNLPKHNHRYKTPNLGGESRFLVHDRK